MNKRKGTWYRLVYDTQFRSGLVSRSRVFIDSDFVPLEGRQRIYDEMATRYGLLQRRYLSTDPVAGESATALDYLRAEEAAIEKAIHHLVRLACDGHCNERIWALACSTLAGDQSDVAAELLAQIKSSPAKGVCGPIETWIAASLENVAHRQLMYWSARDETYRAIDADIDATPGSSHIAHRTSHIAHSSGPGGAA